MVLTGWMVLCIACHQRNEEIIASSPTDAVSPRPTAASGVYFADAEQKLTLGEYSFAASQLNKGIVAYRTETGKFSGNSARLANHAIDGLIALRKLLREGKPIHPEDLHWAVENALAVEGATVPLPGPGRHSHMGVPVGSK